MTQSVQKIVPNVDNVDVSYNEPKNLVYTVNRAIRQLVENDLALYRKYVETFSGMVIEPFDEEKLRTTGYEEDTLVWFMGDDMRLRVLRCVWPDNKTYPSQDRGMYDDSGWHDQFEFLDILDFEVDQMISSTASQQFFGHENDPDYHRFGKLSLDKESPDYIEKKILLHDILNLDNTRKRIFFPPVTRFLDPDDSIIRGFYRRYDTGFIEYDIFFRLGYVDVKYPEKFGTMTILSCNNVRLNQIENELEGGSAGVYRENQKYFYGQSNDIFYRENGSEESYSTVGQLVQMNRNDLVNTYFATLRFPIPFLDLDYSVQCENVMCQTYDGKTMVPAANAMTFCDRTKSSIKAVYVTFPDRNDPDYHVEGHNATTGGICANSFHVKVAGRCIRS